MKQLSEAQNPAIRVVPPTGENGHPNGDEHVPPEMKAAKELARRYRLPFVDLLPPDRESPIDYDLFTEVPVDLMVRHQFVPLKRDFDLLIPARTLEGLCRRVARLHN